MKIFQIQRKSLQLQCLISIAVILVVAGTCYFTTDLLHYRIIALILLLATSIIAMLFEIIPVLIAAVLSALIWNFFFIPPVHTFSINNSEDWLMFLMYFIIALLSAVLSNKIREAEKKARDREEKERTILLYNTLLNSLSHEMRTPLATIIASIDTLQENREKLSDSSVAELLQEMEIAGTRLNRQVENLLSMSRLESGILKLRKDWVDVNELILAVIEKTVNKSHVIQFKPDEYLPLVKLDAGLIEQILNSIIHNAIVYTQDGSTIDIQTKMDVGVLTIIISDNGPGIPENMRESLFDKFYRLPNSKTGGLGLGLSIAKGFTEAHGGSIYVENIDRGGARFVIEIPSDTLQISSLQDE